MKQRVLLLAGIAAALLLLCACSGGEMESSSSSSDSFTDRVVTVYYYGLELTETFDESGAVECSHQQVAKAAYEALHLSEWKQTDKPYESMADETMLFLPRIGDGVRVAIGAGMAEVDGVVYQLPAGAADETIRILKEHAKEHQ